MIHPMRIALAAAAAGVFAFGQAASTPGQGSTTGATGDMSGQAQGTKAGRHSKASTQAQDTNTGGLSKADHSFVMKAAQGGLAEVKLGKLAQERASSAEVKNFGAQMVTDHSKANDKLKGIAQSKNITLPDSLDPKDQALHDKLSSLNGVEFDRAYMNAMRKDHRKDVSEFRKESKSAQDPDIKNFAASTLPTLETHLRMAEATGMARKETGSSATNTGSGARADQTNTDNTGTAPMQENQTRPGTSQDRTGSSPNRTNPNPR